MNTDRQERELIEAWRCVANAKLDEFRRQCWRLAMLVRRGILERTVVVDHLWTVATAHALVRSQGEDRIQAILDECFSGCDFRAMYSEVA
jgi:hypothetical protein